MKSIHYECGCAIVWAMSSLPERDAVERVAVCGYHRRFVDLNASLEWQAAQISGAIRWYPLRAQEVAGG